MFDFFCLLYFHCMCVCMYAGRLILRCKIPWKYHFHKEKKYSSTNCSHKCHFFLIIVVITGALLIYWQPALSVFFFFFSVSPYLKQFFLSLWFIMLILSTKLKFLESLPFFPVGWTCEFSVFCMLAYTISNPFFSGSSMSQVGATAPQDFQKS